MSYEDQLIREATGQNRDFMESCLEEATPEATAPRIEMTQQGETLQ